MKELVDIITPLFVDVQMYKCVWLFEKCLFIWLHQVLVAACKIFHLRCGMQNLSWDMWDLVPWPRFEPRPLLHWEYGVLATGPPSWEVPIMLACRALNHIQSFELQLTLYTNSLGSCLLVCDLIRRAKLHLHVFSNNAFKTSRGDNLVCFPRFKLYTCHNSSINRIPQLPPWWISFYYI